MNIDDLKEIVNPMVRGEQVKLLGPKPPDFTGLGATTGAVLVQYPDGELGAVQPEDIEEGPLVC